MGHITKSTHSSVPTCKEVASTDDKGHHLAWKVAQEFTLP